MHPGSNANACRGWEQLNWHPSTHQCVIVYLIALTDGKDIQVKGWKILILVTAGKVR